MSFRSRNIMFMYKKQSFSFQLSCGLKSVIIALLPFSISAHSSECKIPKSYYKHVSCTPDSRYFLAVADSGKAVALLDESGKKSADLMSYQQVLIEKLHDGLFPVMKNDKLGYLNIKGVVALPFEYDVLDSPNWARGFSNSRVVVKKNDGWGVVDTRNSVIVPFSSKIIAISDYESKQAVITMANKSFTVDMKGKRRQIVDKVSSSKKPAFKQAKIGEQTRPTSTKAVMQEVTLPENRINNLLHTYQLLPSQRQTKPKRSISDNGIKLFPKKENGKWGFVDVNKTTMITYSFDEVTPFSSGLAGVRMGDDWGFINKAGDLIIDFRFYKEGLGNNKNDNYHGMPAFMFYDDYAWIGNLSDGSKLCVNKRGKTARCK